MHVMMAACHHGCLSSQLPVISDARDHGCLSSSLPVIKAPFLLECALSGLSQTSSDARPCIHHPCVRVCGGCGHMVWSPCSMSSSSLAGASGHDNVACTSREHCLNRDTGRHNMSQAATACCCVSDDSLRLLNGLLAQCSEPMCL